MQKIANPSQNFIIPILLNFIYLVALNLLVNNQLNSSLRHIIVTQCFWERIQCCPQLFWSDFKGKTLTDWRRVYPIFDLRANMGWHYFWRIIPKIIHLFFHCESPLFLIIVQYESNFHKNTRVINIRIILQKKLLIHCEVEAVSENPIFHGAKKNIKEDRDSKLQSRFLK